jgi:SAM-dependent methyltransferase
VTTCCGTFTGAADRQFTDRIASRDLARYRAKGPPTTTRLLRDGLVEAGPVTGSLIDIGTGIGSLAFELIEAGVTTVTAIDASAAYIRAASAEAARRGRAESIQFLCADFLDLAVRVAPAATVTLDRVICCYSAAGPLLAEALRHAERSVALSYPSDVWYVRALNAALNVKRRFSGNRFRTFVHSAALVEQVLARAGFSLATRRRTWTWSVDVYVKGSLP